jgi:hypothetical protein
MSNALIICYGYLGDHLFASSIAKKLIEEQQFDTVDYVVGFPQVIPLLNLNPYISNVFFDGNITPFPVTNRTGYAKVIQLGPLSFVEPPCVEFQKVAGVRTPSPDFTVYTDPVIDEHIRCEFENTTELPVVAIMGNWEPKTFRFTKEQYERGIDVPNKGYGGSWRNTAFIIDRIKERFPNIEVGAPSNVTQFQTATALPTTTRSLLEEASILKHCDFFIGAEGGLANLAAGVGCKTILTSDFVHQLYGWNGVIRKIPEPKLGPRYYFTDGHIDLDPYLTDEEVVQEIITIITRSTVNV